MQRIRCYACKYQQFLSEMQSLREKNLTGRARFYEKQAEAVRTRVSTASRLSVLHPCSEDHRKLLIQMRSQAQRASRVQIYEKELKLQNARRLLEGAISALSESILTNGAGHETSLRLNAKVRHYKNLVAQRSRRLGEAKHE